VSRDRPFDQSDLFSIAMFCGFGLLVSLSVLLLDQYVPGDGSKPHHPRPDEQISVTAATFKPWDALACEWWGDPERALQP
jgi:hypothetical protein